MTPMRMLYKNDCELIAEFCQRMQCSGAATTGVSGCEGCCSCELFVEANAERIYGEAGNYEYVQKLLLMVPVVSIPYVQIPPVITPPYIVTSNNS